MRSTSMTTPMLTLPHDALSEIALRLPAVGSTKPWRDVNSLALTCVRLRQWKKTVVDKYVQTEWSEAKKKINGVRTWQMRLEAIISGYENSPTRLFREPILRKITERYPVLRSDVESKSYSKFIAKVFIHRETVSLEDVRECMTACSSTSLNSKSQVVEALPALLPTLSSAHRQQALRMMFELLDKDKKLGLSLKKNGIFKKIEASLDDDAKSEALLELCLRSRRLLKSKPDLGNLGINLECIPSAERWNWVLKKVPECLNTTVGMQAMLNDSVCRPQMINHLDKSFSECPTGGRRFAFCEKVSSMYSKLCECSNGKKLAKKIVHWFLRAQVFISVRDVRLSSRYMNLLIKHIDLVKTYFGIKEKKLLKVAIYKTIQYAIQIKAYDQSTSLLIALAKDDAKVIKYLRICWVPKAALTHALNHAKSIDSLDIRYGYVSALYHLAAYFYRELDPKFVQDFYIEKEANKEEYERYILAKETT